MTIDSHVRALCQTALAHARRHPELSYAELRWVRQKSERLRVRDGAPDGVGAAATSGFGVRVIAHGAWGFSCTPLEEESALLRAVDQALAIAKASALVSQKPVHFPPAAPQIGRYETPLAIDPFAVPIEEKLARLAGPEAELRRGGAPIRSAEAWMGWTELEKLLLTTEGTDVEQRFVYGGAGMLAIAVSSDGRMQRRSYPGTPGTEPLQAGYEVIDAARLLEEAPRIRSEAVELLDADPCPAGVHDVILASSQMALQIHEIVRPPLPSSIVPSAAKSRSPVARSCSRRTSASCAMDRRSSR